MERFWSKVDRRGECWLWTAGVFMGTAGDLPGDRGYGQFHWRGRPDYAHRVSWEMCYGELPEGRMVCHRCDNRSCVRPDHLYLGDAGTNSADAVRRGRSRTQGVRGSAHANALLDEDAVLDIYSKAESQRAYMERYGVARTTVSNIQRGVTWRWLTVGGGDVRPAREKNEVRHRPRRKLSDDDVRAIRASGEPHDVLAGQYGVSGAMVGMIRSGKRRQGVV